MNLRKQLEERLREMPEVKVSLFRDTNLMCVLYRGKELAHFHDHEEIDVRLSPRFIKKEGLSPRADSKYHSKRAEKSRWMQIRFTTREEADALVGLMRRLIAEEYEGTGWGTDL